MRLHRRKTTRSEAARREVGVVSDDGDGVVVVGVCGGGARGEPGGGVERAREGAGGGVPQVDGGAADAHRGRGDHGRGGGAGAALGGLMGTLTADGGSPFPTPPPPPPNANPQAMASFKQAQVANASSTRFSFWRI